MKTIIKNKTIILAALILLTITSCSTYKELGKSPEVVVKSKRIETINTLDSTNIGSISWQHYFKDAKLKELIAEALKNNIDLKVAISRVKQAGVSLGIEKYNRLPNLSVGLQSNNVFADRNTETYSLGFQASWEIDLWGKLNNQTKLKYADFLTSKENQRMVKIQLIANIANAYYRLLSLDKQLEITKQTATILDKNVETMLALKDAGQQNAAGVAQSYALLYNTQINIPNIENQIRSQENLICLLLGKEPQKVERTSFDQVTIKKDLTIGIPAMALSQRPDVKQAQIAIQKAYSNIKVAKANLYPSLKITSATLGYSGNTFSNFFKLDYLAASIIGSLTQPLFNKKQIKGTIKIASLQQKEALLNFKHTVLKATEEVANILFSYEKSVQKDIFRNKHIAVLKNAVDYSKELLIAGEANYTEVLTAQQNLLMAQLNKVQEKYDQLIYGVNIYKAIGGGTY